MPTTCTALRDSEKPRARVISFDADGTLWDFEKAMRASLAHTLIELQRIMPQTAPVTATLTVDRLIAIRDEVAEEMYGRGSTMEDIRLAAFVRALESVGYPDSEMAQHLTAFYLDRRFGDIAPYPDVIPALDQLRDRYRLGLVSNGNTYPERCGLAGRFAFTVFAQDHGARKPSSAFYEAVLQEAAVTADVFIHIGDSLTNDIAGAQAVGMRTVWLNRDRRKNTGAIQPDAEITSLHDLLPILDTL